MIHGVMHLLYLVTLQRASLTHINKMVCVEKKSICVIRWNLWMDIPNAFSNCFIRFLMLLEIRTDTSYSHKGRGPPLPLKQEIYYISLK